MPDSTLQMVEAFLQAGELADALEALNRHLNTNPTDTAARRLRAALLVRLSLPGDEHLRAALEDLDVLPAPTVDDWVQRSVVLHRLNKMRGAVEAMRQAYLLRPDDERTAERYLDLLLQAGEHNAARALLESLPRTWRWLERAGDLAAAVGDRRGAVEQYTAALVDLEGRLDTAANTFGGHLWAALLAKRAAAALALDDLALAEADYTELEARLKDLWFAFFRGLVIARRGDLDAAAAVCRAALERGDDSLRRRLLRVIEEDDHYAALRGRLTPG